MAALPPIPAKKHPRAKLAYPCATLSGYLDGRKCDTSLSLEDDAHSDRPCWFHDIADNGFWRFHLCVFGSIVYTAAESNDTSLASSEPTPAFAPVVEAAQDFTAAAEEARTSITSIWTMPEEDVDAVLVKLSDGETHLSKIEIYFTEGWERRWKRGCKHRTSMFSAILLGFVSPRPTRAAVTWPKPKIERERATLNPKGFARQPAYFLYP
jgi:hypothetical protein